MFDDRIMIRNEVVDGETDWFWIIGDNGAWDGPKMDWETSHKHKYFVDIAGFETVVTAGGNQGMYTRLYSKIFKNVYSFEPDALNFFCLVNNAQSDNVFKFNCGLGAAPSFFSIKRPSADNSGMHEIVNEPGNVPVLPLDAFNFQRIDLLQLDVEGYEYNVLLGAQQTIKRCKPIIILERGVTEEIKTFMYNHEYELKDQSISDFIWRPK